MESILCGGRPEGLLKPGGSPTHSREHQAGLQVRLQENIIQDFSAFPLWSRVVREHNRSCLPVVCLAGHTPLDKEPVELFSHYIPVAESWCRSIINVIKAWDCIMIEFFLHYIPVAESSWIIKAKNSWTAHPVLLADCCHLPVPGVEVVPVLAWPCQRIPEVLDQVGSFHC